MDGSFWSTVDNNCSEFVDDAGTSSAFSLTAAPDLATWTSPGSAGQTVSSPLVATVGLIVCGHCIYSISSSSAVIGRPSSVVVVVDVVGCHRSSSAIGCRSSSWSSVVGRRRSWSVVVVACRRRRRRRPSSVVVGRRSVKSIRPRNPIHSSIPSASSSVIIQPFKS